MYWFDNKEICYVIRLEKILKLLSIDIFTAWELIWLVNFNNIIKECINNNNLHKWHINL